MQTQYTGSVTTYEGASGLYYYNIYAVTFSGLNFAVTGGTLYDFAVGATANSGACTSAPSSPCTLSLSSSNAALSGSVQNGADNLWDVFTASDSAATLLQQCDSAATSAPYYCGVGDSGPAFWDKSSDINVTIDGTETPEPSTLTTMAAGLAGLVVLVRRRRKS